MGSFIQMGHNTENLVGEKDLGLFEGIILSPVNRTPIKLNRYIHEFRKKGTFEIIFDPQLYFPRASKGLLHTHPYFPANYETNDFNTFSWLAQLNSKLVPYVNSLNVDSVCSPIVYFKSWKEEFYTKSVEIQKNLKENLERTNPKIKCYLTVILNVRDLSDEEKIMKTTSIISSSENDGFYIVFVNDTLPRLELKSSDELYGMLKFVSELKRTQRQIIVTHCSSDLILFKYAGATHCSTGKYFNLRRFSQSRFIKEESGRGQLPYWFEPNLLGFLREPDLSLLLMTNSEVISNNLYPNYWSNKILQIIQEGKGAPWIADGWRQYLSVFSQLEKMTENNPSFVLKLLEDARLNWIDLERKSIRLDEEKTNNGSWIPIWKNTLELLNSD